jgi:hypothetical protein
MRSGAYRLKHLLMLCNLKDSLVEKISHHDNYIKCAVSRYVSGIKPWLD